MMNPISVIMPVYNTEKYIRESINSILNQTYEYFELIVIDDHSTDNTLKIIEELKVVDNRIKIIKQDNNQGPAIARNLGIQHATGDYIALMDADDISNPKRFEKQIDFLLKNPTVDICGTNYSIFYKNNKTKLVELPQDDIAIKTKFLFDMAFGNPTLMFRSYLKNSVHFNSEYVPIEDYELFCNLSKTIKCTNLPESLLDYRWHDNNISITKAKNIFNKKIKIKKSYLITLNDHFITTNIDTFIKLFEIHLNESPQEIIKVLEAKTYFNQWNAKHQKYCKQTLNNELARVLIKNIRKAKNYNLSLLKELKYNHSEIYNRIKWYDRLLINFNCIFNL